ncbi:MAG: EAL domain-containing protein [Phyllobacteriaceae bacterium]|nr:EAL domain-containing protein [Phyllobacteriaceae bacterium]
MLTGEMTLLHRVQTEVLEAVARGMELAEVGRILCREVEQSAPDVMCSILLVDDTGHLHSLAAPTLPAEFSAAIENLAIGPKVGSCGTAAWRREPVLVTDIATDPLWEDYRGLALSLGLRACWSTPIFGVDGSVIGTFAFYYDVSRGPTELERSFVDTSVHLCSLAIEHDRTLSHNRRLAFFDPLTDLPNRASFQEFLRRAIKLKKPFGLILLDIDNLKLVNDSIGHLAGDALIRAVGHRLAECGADISASRVGGDEFAILVDGCSDHDQLQGAADTILAHTMGMVAVDEQSVMAHVTLGGALYGVDGTDEETLAQNADFALYHAKQTHRGGYRGFRPDLRTAMVQRIEAVRQLDSAMAEGWVVPHYQPIVRLDNSAIVGLEALARITMPDGRIASAGEFHSGLSDPRIAYELTGHMLDQVARDIRVWLDAGLDFQHVGINVTTGDFQRGDLAERIGTIFARHDVPLRYIALEVNESVFMGGSDLSVPLAVEALRAQGILVALDDFGTGFASLTHLMSFPVDVIKIDRSFTERLGIDDKAGEVVVRAILDIARRLDMRVVAEGIETDGQLEVLTRFGCPMGQGFRFSRPVSVDETTKLLRQSAEDPSDSSRRSA